jgi:hypothetical protein
MKTTTTMSNLPQANMPWPQRGGYTSLFSLFFFFSSPRK